MRDEKRVIKLNLQYDLTFVEFNAFVIKPKFGTFSWFSFGMRDTFIDLSSIRVLLKIVMSLSNSIVSFPSSSIFVILPFISEFSSQNFFI